MLTGINPILTGALLMQLDAMGHSDAVVVADAHFPARRLGRRVIELPGHLSPVVTKVLMSVLPLDDHHCLDLMASTTGKTLEIHNELIRATGQSRSVARFIERDEFYAASERAYLIIRSGEMRSYGNVLLRKGLVEWDRS